MSAKKTILSVDDSAATRQMVRFTLEQAGYSVLECESGEKAIQTLTRGTPADLLLADLNMPGMDGIELARKVRAMDRFRYIPVLMLTTESTAEKSRKAAGPG